MTPRGHEGDRGRRSGRRRPHPERDADDAREPAAKKRRRRPARRSSVKACRSTRAASTGSTNTGAMTTSGWRLRRNRRSRRSAATPTTSSSRAGASTCRCCARTRTASRPRRRRICKFNWAGARDEEPVFVAGHPGTTQRLLTVAQLKTERDLVTPFWLLRFSELRGRLIQYSKSSPEAARTAKDYLDTIENSIKVRRQQLVRAARRSADGSASRADEQKLRASVKADAALASARRRRLGRHRQGARQSGATSTFRTSGSKAAPGSTAICSPSRAQLVRAADERAKPNADRLREYTDARLAALASSRSRPTRRSIPSSSRSGCRSRSSACASGSGRITRS